MNATTPVSASSSDLERNRFFMVEQQIRTWEVLDPVILDLLMPEVTGFDVVGVLRQHPQAKDIPILIFTAKDITEADRAELNSHVRAIVPKSGHEELLHELEKLNLTANAS